MFTEYFTVPIDIKAQTKILLVYYSNSNFVNFWFASL